jgi:hypothetical protein
MGEEALIPLRLFTNRTVAWASIGSVFIGMGMFGGLAALPLYLQIVKGASATQAGLQLLPDDPRHHVRLDPVRPAHLAHRPLPPLPDHGCRPCSWCRCSSSTIVTADTRCGSR